MGFALACPGMGCSYFQGVPPSAIGLSIMLLILTDPPHASTQTSILGESNGGPPLWLSLFLLSVGEALRQLKAAPENEAALASVSLSTSARSSCSCGCPIADLGSDYMFGGPRSIVMYHVHQSATYTERQALVFAGDPAQFIKLPPGLHLIGLKSKTAYIRDAQTQPTLPPLESDDP